MRRDTSAQRAHVDLRPAGSPVVVRPPLRRHSLAWLSDAVDLLAWPVVTTALSLVGARRLIGHDEQNYEPDVFFA